MVSGCVVGSGVFGIIDVCVVFVLGGILESVVDCL